MMPPNNYLAFRGILIAPRVHRVNRIGNFEPV
jgi:hypothetical protein